MRDPLFHARAADWMLWRAPATFEAVPCHALIRWATVFPGRAFAVFALLHTAVWTVLPSLLYLNLPLDLIEALTYGREWQLGYDKLPPLPWWMVEIAYRLIGHDFAYYLMAQVAVIAAFAAVFAMARPLIGGAGALLAVLIVDGLHYFNATAVKFNHDVIQLPFWALAGLALHRALRRGEMRHWLLLGLAVGMALWAKYFVVVLAVPMIVFVLADREARRCLATPGPYIAVATALVVTAPHLVWLVRNDFLPFAYVEHRAVPSYGAIDHLWHPLQFAIGQLYFLLPTLLIAAPLLWPAGAAEKPDADRGGNADAFDHRIIALLAFGPLAAVLALSAVSGRGTVALWGYPLWLYLGVWLVAQRPFSAAAFARCVQNWSIVFIAIAVIFTIIYTVVPQFRHRYVAEFFPGRSLAAQITQRYRAATGQPVVYVIASMWTGGNIAHYGPSHPRVLIDGLPWRAPWIDLADLQHRGAVVVWTDGDRHVVPEQYRQVAPGAIVQAPFMLESLRGDITTEVGWAIVPAH